MITRETNKDSHRLLLQEDREYEVQTILDCHRYFGIKYYLVKWKGYSDDHNTWEPVEHLAEIINNVLQFDYQVNKKYKIKRQQWQIYQIQLQINKIKKQCLGLKGPQQIKAKSIALALLFEKQKMIQKELLELRKQFEMAENSVCIKKINKQQEPIIIEKQQNFILNKDNKIYFEIGRNGKMRILTTKPKSKHLYTLTQQTKNLSFQARVQVSQKNIAKNSDTSDSNLLQNSSKFISSLNKKDLIQARGRCIKIFSNSFPQSYMKCNGRINCNTQQFHLFTNQCVLKYTLGNGWNSQLYPISEIAPKISKLLIDQDDNYLTIDFQTLLVYYPHELLEYLKEKSQNQHKK